ncbi:MAG: hypothetical protein M0P16_11940 [Syntrophales bacterium]|jgi:hypothetical protein|nr:hypothetical protein [Syntrophales bacterium]MCK9391614.1 hypothetical protein [Syntrophales bacterium]
MDSREITFLIGFLTLGVAPIFASQLSEGMTEMIMLLGMIIATSTAFCKSSK